MPKQNRLNLVGQIEHHRNSRLLAIVLGDRQGLETRVAGDALSLTARLLERIGRIPALDVFLYSTGGLTMAAFALVNLIREYAERFSVLVPYKAQSPATLISLGADEIVMTPLATLSPVDPSTNSPFNPLVPNLPAGAFPPQMLPVSVEDVASYIDLAKVEAGLNRRSDLREVFLRLAQDVRPLALGTVHRARTQIKMLARKLLSSHSADRPRRRTDKVVEVLTGQKRRRVDRIVDVLTKELFSHDYTIARREAREEMGLSVTYPDPTLEGLMMQLYRGYEADLSLLDPYNQDKLLGANNAGTFTFERAYIETGEETFGFVTVREITRVQVMAPFAPGVPAVGFSERLLGEGWQTL